MINRRYSSFVKMLINKYFPILKSQKIIVSEKDVPYRAHVCYPLFSKPKIIFSTKIRNLSKKVIKRIIIHELCHLEIFIEQGRIMTNLQYLGYILFKRIRNNVEREANILMIKKGFGRLVLDARKENLKRGLSYSLTEKEIKQFMKKSK